LVRRVQGVSHFMWRATNCSMAVRLAVISDDAMGPGEVLLFEAATAGEQWHVCAQQESTMFQYTRALKVPCVGCVNSATPTVRAAVSARSLVSDKTIRGCKSNA
jgi:hypothetical protein